MAKSPTYQIGGINLAVNPLAIKQGDLLKSVNVETFPYGAKRKRPGYTTYLGTMPNGSSVQDLANFGKNNGTQFWNYAFAGGILYYSQQGTGDWTISGGGTLSAAGTLTAAVLEDTLVIGDGVSATRHSTSGTSFTNTSAAPIAVSLSEYHQRVFAAGTASNLFWSNVGTPTDWTNDSSSVLIPGAGKLASIFKVGERGGDTLVASKNSGNMFSFDEFALNDFSTKLAPTSQRSIGNIEGHKIYLNRLGYFDFAGVRPTIISSAIERQIYNDSNTGIAGTTFDSAPGVGYQYRYYCSVGTVTDDLSKGTVSDAVQVYDFKYNDWWNYSFANRPSAWLPFKDVSGNDRLIFSSGSQCYEISGTASSDNGSTIASEMEGVIHYGDPGARKDWRYLRAFFNPGCRAKIQIGLADTFTSGAKTWIDLGDATDGVVEYRFPSGAQSRLLFWRIYEASRETRFNFYGFECDATLEPER